VDVLLAIPKTLGDPHTHRGLGIRKVHRTGIYEARVGLKLRLLFAQKGGDLILVTLGTHDGVRKYLSSL
jgi:hypothetical protein